MSEILDELRKTQKPEKKDERHTGYVWVSMLIKYNLDGSATLISSFSKPAQESKIKGIIKKKVKPKRIETAIEEYNEEELF